MKPVTSIYVLFCGRMVRIGVAGGTLGGAAM